MKERILMFFFAVSSSCSPAHKAPEQEAAVRESVNRQLKEHPKSTLKDLYKSFFQDRFGPGHIITDISAAKNYLIQELDACSIISGEMIEPTGWQHNFYRVSLGVVKNSLIPHEILLDAFIRSANEVEPVTVEKWRKEWTQIETVIRAMNLTLPDYETDRRDIDGRLQKGNFVGHHSEAYNRAYNPHYRIISRKIFEEEILLFNLIHK
ncbi:MAG: hypothetical protein LBM08_10505 [Dysgonamonadaceae bacterium]|jgi:hypothetical protein|nr:hypothetical protein [Dysgonamonadaceae bacterium]